MNAIREHLEAALGRQIYHPVHPRVEVLWDEPCNLEVCTIRVGGFIERVAPEMVVRRVGQRNRMIENEKKDPLRNLCEPEHYRRIDLEVVRKRLRHPGVPLALWVSGGIRSSKTEFCTRRVSANFWFTEGAWCWGLHETDTTSREIQQARVYRFIPPEMRPESGKQKKDKETKFSYSEGTGFTGSEFNVYWEATHADGVKKKLGGRFGFRFYGQDPGTMVGQELTCATSDELIPPKILKLVDDRLLTRAEDTARPEFMALMREALEILERGEFLPLPLLGAVYHGWHLISFTPKEGWTASCAQFLMGAVKYAFYDPRPWVHEAMQKKIASMPTLPMRSEQVTEFERKPWTLGDLKQVPAFAQPAAKLKLVAYLPTHANKFKGNWAGAVESVQGHTETEIKIKLFGDVDKNWLCEFGDFEPQRDGRPWHVRKWSVMPRTGTIYLMCDPAGRKPYFFCWYLADALGRIWKLQEWPCPHWEIEGHGKPGAWAIPSENENRNGDVGPAQELQLRGFNRARWTRLVWEGNKRILTKMAETGKPWAGRVVNTTLMWKDRPDWTLEGPFAEVETALIDKRYCGNQTDADEGVITILEDFLRQENKIDFCKAFAGSGLVAGTDLVRSALCTEIEGMPGFMVNEECENSVFALSTYSLPQFSETTKKWDEACKDPVDCDVMCFGCGAEDTTGVQMTS